MAILDKHFLFPGLRGRIGNLVFRRCGDKVVVSQYTPRSSGPTPGEQKNSARFKEAARYARQVLDDPGLKAIYAEKARGSKSAYNLAIADFIVGPTIEKIEAKDYTGAQGGIIRIRAIDDFEVASVYVKIFRPSGSLVEKGFAVPGRHDVWHYEARRVNRQLTGSRILVEVMDRPGNCMSEALIIGQ